MKKTFAVATIILSAAAAYFLLWPVPVDPVAWQAPTDRGYVDPYAINDRLKIATAINLGNYEGPEDATIGIDGRIYATTSNGKIIRIQNRGIRVFANPGGRPLGIETDHDGSLVIANATIGIQRVSLDGDVTTLLDTVDGQPLVFANNLGIGPDRTIYFSESTSKFGAEEFGGPLSATLLDIMEHGGHGRVFSFNPSSGDVQTLMRNLNYANGVAVSKDGSFLVVAEMGHYRILKHWLTGEKKGVTEVLIDNLPGFPDNIKNGINGRFWVGFAAPRNQLLDSLAEKPFLRRLVQRLPASLRPNAEPFSHVIAFNGDGDVLMNLHDPDVRFATLTGVLETRDALYLTMLFGNQLARIDKRDL